MLKRRNSLFILLIIIFLSFTNAFSQKSFVVKDDLKWQITTKQDKNQSLQEILWFDGAGNDFQNPLLPVFRSQIPLPADGTVSIFPQDAIWTEITENISASQLQVLPSAIHISGIVKKAALQPVATISFVPMRKNPVTGKAEKLTHFALRIIFTPAPAAASTKRQKKDITESALAKGYWYKLGVTESGIYKIDEKYFREIGFDAANTDIRNVQIYGKPGGMLPESNAVSRDEDLVENAIEVHDENNNNRLDGNDYILFYAKGPISWKYNSVTKNFEHQANYYEDAAYYFITAGNMPGKRISQKPNMNAAGEPVTTYNNYALHEADNLTDVMRNVKSGREWFGEEFKSLNGDPYIDRNFDFNFPGIDINNPVYVKTGVLARAKYPSSFGFFVNGSSQGNIKVADVDVDNYQAPFVAYSDYKGTFPATGDKISVMLRYNKSTVEAVGWLDFIELNVRSLLRYRSGQFSFRDAKNTGTAAINKYIISGAPGNLQVWDVSNFHNAQRQEMVREDDGFTFTSTNENINEYVAFDGNGFLTPQKSGQVANQNLHGLEQTDMVIISHPEFLPAANRLAERRRSQDGLTVHVITPQQVYNEFASGGQDICAIRDFMRMFYKRAETNGSKKPRYLLLFGDASYDYKNRSAHNTNHIPTYQSEYSLQAFGSYCADDYYGFLDDDEGIWTESDNLDIAIGRIPVRSLDEANQMIDKIVRYEDPKSKNAWRNTLTFVADDEDDNTHFKQTESLINKVEKEAPAFNAKKIYLDAFVQDAGSSQPRYPAATREVNTSMASGALIINYVGHGGELGLAHEKLVEIPDINSWDNDYKYPLFITATCEFSRFDDPERTSAGELVFLNPRGGAIAMYTTTRVVEVTMNAILNRNILVNNLFIKENGKAKRIGDIFMLAKNRTGFDENTRSFTLLGDPSLRLALPEYNVVATKVNATNTTEGIDTLKALSLATIYGEVQIDGAKASDFNGIVYPVVFDKPALEKTLGNDPGSSASQFFTQENVLYKGKATVTNGSFSFSFPVPKDISFKEGFGKLSFYAENKISDANGYYDSVIVGGSAANPFVDEEGPQIRLFMNDTLFKAGGLTDQNPVLIAKVSDDIGINTTGNGIGHDLTATLNNGEPIAVNDYYQADLNDYRKGEIRYPFHQLADGNYNLKVKVWDVSNNSAEASTDFVVASSAKLALDKIFNYPNPFNTQTIFNFEHNRPNEPLSVHIAIYTMSGQLIKEIKQEINTAGNRSNTIIWNGRNSTGGEIASGMYIYKLTLKTNDGQIAQQSQRLVVIK